MEIYSDIKKKIVAMSGKKLPLLLTAKVESVDGETCTVSIGMLKLTDVRLRSVVNGESSQILITPKIGSYVTVADLSGELRALEVIGWSEIDKIEIGTETDICVNCNGDTSIDCSGTITINGGDNHGMAKVEAVAEKLSALEKDLNNLKQSIATWIPVAYDGGASLKAATASWAAQTFVTTTYQDIENTKITH